MSAWYCFDIVSEQFLLVTQGLMVKIWIVWSNSIYANAERAVISCTRWWSQVEQNSGNDELFYYPVCNFVVQ